MLHLALSGLHQNQGNDGSFQVYAGSGAHIISTQGGRQSQVEPWACAGEGEIVT